MKLFKVTKKKKKIEKLDWGNNTFPGLLMA